MQTQLQALCGLLCGRRFGREAGARASRSRWAPGLQRAGDIGLWSPALPLPFHGLGQDPSLQIPAVLAQDPWGFHLTPPRPSPASVLPAGPPGPKGFGLLPAVQSHWPLGAPGPKAHLPRAWAFRRSARTCLRVHTALPSLVPSVLPSFPTALPTARHHKRETHSLSQGRGAV